jgi:hypothetical protein
VPSTRMREGSGANPPIMGLMADMLLTLAAAKWRLGTRSEKVYVAIGLRSNDGVCKG